MVPETFRPPETSTGEPPYRVPLICTLFSNVADPETPSVPVTDSVWVGTSVPMPTLPLPKTVTTSSETADPFIRIPKDAALSL